MIKMREGNKEVTAYDGLEFLQDVIEASEGGKFVLSGSNEFYPRFNYAGSFSVTLVPAAPAVPVAAPTRAKKAVEEAAVEA